MGHPTVLSCSFCIHMGNMVMPTFAAWAATFGKSYNGDEFAAREAIYNANVAKYEAHNADETQTFTMGVNQFTDLTLEEFQALNIRGFVKSGERGLAYLGEHEDTEVAAGVDWRTKGAVTPVKNQGQCGSCWAFSTIGGLEGAWEIGTGTLTSMSEQQLVDCSKANLGSNGGIMESGFQFEQGVNVATESSYPYTARDGSCKSSGYSTAIPRGGVTGYKSGGVITSGCGTQLDHGVTAVGYTSDYFIVKNSWGASWGNNGYVYISTSGNVCGIHSDASYPTVSGSVQV